MGKYNWQQSDWPHFRYDLLTVEASLYLIAEKMGALKGKLSSFSDELQTETVINLMVEEAVKSAEIEGEKINPQDVRSSIKNKLDLHTHLISIKDKRAQGIAELMVDARNTFKEPLSGKQLFHWHRLLFMHSISSNLIIGSWRQSDEPMQIISGRHGKVSVHFEAPPSRNVPKEMKRFIRWFNELTVENIKLAPIHAAISHLYFESIHPFDDGNGRIGRAIAQKALSKGFGYPVLLSLSNTIEARKKEYYAALKTASRSNEVTSWILYFLNVILNAQEEIETQINFILKKSIFFNSFAHDLNDRQLKVINRMMNAGPKGFKGGMTAKKYMAITGVSKATATRDQQFLLSIGAFIQTGSGRSAHYQLNM